MRWGPLLLLGTVVAVVFAKRGKRVEANPFVKRADALEQDQAKPIPGVFMVEFDHSTFGKRDGQSVIDTFHKHLGSLVSPTTNEPVSYTTRFEWKDSIFPGLSLALSHPSDAAVIHDAPHVKNVYPVHRMKLSVPPPAVPNKDILAQVKKGMTKRDGNNSTDTFVPHVMMGVDRLRAENITGDGVVIGVIDTGVDRSHPMLKDQVIGGKAFVDDNFDGSNDPGSNGSIDTHCGEDAGNAGHGTHVSGILVGRDIGLGLSGVAPDAKLKMYRVFGCTGSSTDDVLVSAMLHAAFDGVDLISMSVVAPSGWAEHPISVVATRIIKAGIPIFSSSGNTGYYGGFFGQAPSSALHITSVGSVDLVEELGYWVSTIQSPPGPSPDLFLRSFNPFSHQDTVPIKTLSNNPDTDDATLCEADSLAQLGDLSNFVVMAPRTVCAYSDVIDTLKSRNASAVLIWNTKIPQWTGDLQAAADDEKFQDVSYIPYDEAAEVLKAIGAGAQVSVNFAQQRAGSRVNKETGGLSSTYTTVGPEWDLHESVHVSGPGSNILSTWPVENGGYAILSGTSMSAPMVAGVAALLISHQGKGVVHDIRCRLQSRSVPFKQAESDNPESTARAGSGLIDAFATVTGTLKATPSALSLGDTAHFNGTQRIEIVNYGSQDVTFNVTHVPAATFLLTDPSTSQFNFWPIPLDESAVADAVPNETSMTVPAGQSHTFQVAFTAPTSDDAKTMPLYSGRIILSSPDGQTLNVPYMGVAADLQAVPSTDVSSEYSQNGDPLPLIVDSDGNTIKDDSHVFTLASNDTFTDSPTLIAFMNVGSGLVTVDLVPANTTFQPTIAINDGTSNSTAKSKRDILRHSGMMKRHMDHRQLASLRRRQATNSTTSYGNIEKDPWAARSTIDFGVESFSYSFGNVTYDPDTRVATQIQDGEYRMLFRHAKLFTDDFTDEANFDSYLSHAFTIQQQQQNSTTSG